MNYRPVRVGKLIREELSKTLERELEFPGALVTITEVVVDKKLETAKAGVSVLPGAKADEVMRSLGRSRSRLQFLVARKINIKPMPRIQFEIDRGPEEAAKVEKLLRGE